MSSMVSFLACPLSIRFLMNLEYWSWYDRSLQKRPFRFCKRCSAISRSFGKRDIVSRNGKGISYRPSLILVLFSKIERNFLSSRHKDFDSAWCWLKSNSNILIRLLGSMISFIWSLNENNVGFGPTFLACVRSLAVSLTTMRWLIQTLSLSMSSQAVSATPTIPHPRSVRWPYGPLSVGAMMSLGVNALVLLYPISWPTSQSCNGKIKLAMGSRCGHDSATSGEGMCARFAGIMSLV